MQQKSNKLTLKEIAKHLGVSTATVSNAFNRPDQLSAKLRDKILSESAQLGYTGPNLAARSLRRGESGVIAVVLADSLSYSFSDPVANQLLQGIADELVVHNKQLLLLTSENHSAEQSMAESLPDGFIFYGTPQTASFARILRTGKAAIAVDFEQDQIGSVNIDNYQAAKSVAKHAVVGEKDHIAVLGMRIIGSNRISRLLPNEMDVPSTEISRRRLNGYIDGATEQGNQIFSDRVWHIPINNPEQAEIAAREALTVQPRPNVLLCMSDVIALSALRIANELGINVPDELRVVGFDDIPEASRTAPRLTTICQQSSEKGRLAANLLLTDQYDQHKILTTSLIIRESS